MNYVKLENGNIVEGPLPYRPDDSWLEYVVDTLPYVENTPKITTVDITPHRYTIKEHYFITYADRRRQEYPPIVDQLDALWKGGESLEQMKQQILAVKEKYPKDKQMTQTKEVN